MSDKVDTYITMAFLKLKNIFEEFEFLQTKNLILISYKLFCLSFDLNANVRELSVGSASAVFGFSNISTCEKANETNRKH